VALSDAMLLGIAPEHYVAGESEHVHHASVTVESPSFIRTEDWDRVTCLACKRAMPPRAEVRQ
jgi:hypothetical protein